MNKHIVNEPFSIFPSRRERLRNRAEACAVIVGLAVLIALVLRSA
jgi:hypothetical protein